MREIHVPPKKATTRYGCDFCKKTTARKDTMERHEKICYYNPDRVCPICDGSGRIQEWDESGHYKIVDDECYPCKIAREALEMQAVDQKAKQEREWRQERQEMARMK